ncbi:hypothetical protein BY66_23430 [Escherichia coli O157:H7 str. K1921]|nr:hypothetical protein BY66_23430 [Escherichia coli O157:H7 str. K1921]
MRLRAGRVITSRLPVKRKRQNWQTTWKKVFHSTCLNHSASIICNATGPAKKPLPVRLMTMLSFRSAWQNTSGTWLKPLLTTRLILIQRYKTDEYSTRNAGREAG